MSGVSTDVVVVAAGAGFATGLFIALVVMLALSERRKAPGFLENRNEWGAQ